MPHCPTCETMHIHQNIKHLRKRKGWTQKDLSEKIDKTYITVGDYERGKIYPPLPILLRLSELFGLSLDQLVLQDVSAETPSPPEPDQAAELQRLEEELQTLRRLNRLQEQRLSELEREIRERAPELAGRLGL